MLPQPTRETVSLVGCGNIAEKAAEDALKDEGIDADIDGSDISIEGTDFNVTTGKLAKDFPVDEVPVVDGKILEGTYAKNAQTWTADRGRPGRRRQAGGVREAEEKLGADSSRAHRQRHPGSVDQPRRTACARRLSVTDSNRIVVNYLVAPK